MSYQSTLLANNMPAATTNIIDVNGELNDLITALFQSLNSDLYIGCKSKSFVKEEKSQAEFEQRVHREIKISIRRELELSKDKNVQYEMVKLYNNGSYEVYFFYLTHILPNYDVLVEELSQLSKPQKERLISGLISLQLKTEFMEQTKDKYEFSPSFYNAELYLSVQRSGREKKNGTAYFEVLKPEIYFSPTQELCFELKKKVFKTQRLEAVTADLDETKALFKNKEFSYQASRDISATKFSKRKFMSFGEKYPASVNYAQNLISDILQGILNRLDIAFEPRIFNATHVTDQFLESEKEHPSNIVLIDNLGRDFDPVKKDKALSQLHSEFEKTGLSIVKPSLAIEDMSPDVSYIVLNEGDGNSSITLSCEPDRVFTGFWDAYCNTNFSQKQNLDYYTRLKIDKFESQTQVVIQGLNFSESDKESIVKGDEERYAISPYKLERIKSELWLKQSVFINQQFTDINLPSASLKLVYVRKTARRKNNFFASVVEVTIKDNVLKITNNQVIKSEARLKLECSFFGERNFHNGSFYLYDEDNDVLLTSYSTIRVPQVIGNTLVDSISVAESDERTVNRQSSIESSVLPYYLLPKERKQYHHVYLQEAGVDLFYFVAQKQRPNQDIAKQNRIYNLLTFNSKGDLLNALEQPVTHLFFNSFTEDILKINEVSKSSLLEKIAKLYIEN